MIERRIGSAKNNRTNKKLLDSSFQIDQRSFWDIMGYLSSYLEKINYYNIQNQLDGDWKALIKDDPVIFMVLIINEPLADLNLLAQHYNETKTINKNHLAAIQTLLAWHQKVDQWSVTLQEQGELKLANKIKNVLADILDHQRDHLHLQLQKITPKTKKSASTKRLMAPAPPKLTTEMDFGKVIHTFQKVIIHIQNFTRDYLRQNIFAENNHAPNNALYIAFTVLFKNVQKNLNTLSQRHLDFYYKEVLQQQNSKGKPTRTIVNFDLLPNITYSLIEKGTLLSAGKLFENQEEVLFKTEKPLVVYSIELMELKTLNFNTCPYIKVGTDKQLISSVSINNLMSKGKDVAKRDKWLVFGANKQTVQNTQIDAGMIGNMGFIIDSPVLALSEGKRSIALQINMEDNTAKNIFWKLMNEIKVNEKMTMDMVFSRVFDQSLKIEYTTKKGWIPFEDYSITSNENKNQLTIQLVLDNANPPLEHGVNISEELRWPAIKVGLNEYAPVFLYSFFKGVEIDTIDIHVEVQRLRNLSLYNNIGKIDPGKTFELFGAQPAVGSFLMIGKSELFQKQIKTLEVVLEWDTIPNDFGGFDTYYDGYPEDIKNDDFQVQLSALSNSYWLPVDLSVAPISKLYRTHQCLTPEGYTSKKLDATSSIMLNEFSKMGTSQDFNLKDPLIYSVASQSGFIKLTLVTPEHGYGTDLYQKEYIDIATYNAKNKTNLPYPNKPYVPKVKEVAVNYTASDTLCFNESLSDTTATGENSGEFLHITPFGLEEVITNQTVKSRTLLADFEQEGYLFLGLKGIDGSSTISIFFHFLQSSTGVNINEKGLTWEYFRINRWEQFDEGDIILDETNGFIKSGIIEIILPEVKEIEAKGEEELYWIRISTKTNTQHYPQIKGIYLNAVEATCVSEDKVVIGKEVPAGSIKQFVEKKPDIKKVNQPTKSSGGVPEGTNDQFYRKVSERLRHKSRAVSIWDYERLILDNFDEVRVVKCTNLNKAFNPVPQQVKVIVLSDNWTNEERHYFDENKLIEMKTFLQEISSPFVDIRVLNPTVEYLLVNAVVEFMPEDNGGYYLNLLNENISEFLSPLASIENGVGGIGGKVVPTMVSSYLENRSYIKKVEKLTIEHIRREGMNDYTLGVFKDGEVIQATTPWSILSPVNQHHLVSIVNENQFHDILEVGVGNMEIGLDLILENELSNKEFKQMESSTVTAFEETLTNDAIFVFKNKTTK